MMDATDFGLTLERVIFQMDQSTPAGWPHAVACNIARGTRVFPAGAKAYVVSFNHGNGSERVKIAGRSRGKRWVTKWEPARNLANFRVVTVVENVPRFACIVNRETLPTREAAYAWCDAMNGEAK